METAMTADEVLVRRALDDISAFGHLYDRYLPQVYAYVYYQVGNQATAEDLTAHIFERVLRKLGTYRAEKASFKTWLFRVARHAVIDHNRRQGLRRMVGLDTASSLPTSDPGPVEQAEREADLEQLHTYLGRLSRREREIITLKFASELSYKEIGGMLGLSESNVGTIYHRTISKLRGFYAEEDGHE